MEQLGFNDSFKMNTDGTFTNRVKLRIADSEIHNITISEMKSPQFDTELSSTKNSTFHIEIDSNNFYNINNII